ncbi:MAG: DUF1905 domain-containing protein [Gemmatimonadetes bacterium]|nr:DUF1905 domain-containing protein [Gemmatimonadota bacterium]
MRLPNRPHRRAFPALGAVATRDATSHLESIGSGASTRRSRRRCYESRFAARRCGGFAWRQRQQVRVCATFDGHECRVSIAPVGGESHMLGMRKDVRAAIGKDLGDTVQVTLRRGTERRTIVVPSER